jgi:hypothetical protein
MKNSQKAMESSISEKNETKDKRKKYEAPILQELGSINAITSDTTINMSIE